MVIKGLRKNLNGNIEAQKASVQAAEQERRDKLEALRFRQSIAWYHPGSNLWLEIEAGSSLIAGFSHVAPAHYIEGFSVKSPLTGEKLPVEKGFIADGLDHVVWIAGGRYGGGGLVFDREVSKVTVHQQLIVGNAFGRLTNLFFDLYKLRISVPAIQQALNVGVIK